MEPKDNPATESVEYTALKDIRQQIADILAGPITIRKKRQVYLKQFPDEGPEEYLRRVESAPWRPEFEDALTNLVSRPFGKDVVLRGTQDDRILGEEIDIDGQKQRSGGYVDDIDGRGNSLTVFSKAGFADGLAMGLSAIFVDHPDTQDEITGTPQVYTVAEAEELNIRPYWVHVDALQIIALVVKYEGGKIIPVHIRIRESVTEQDGFQDKTFDQIRVLEIGKWTIYREKVVGGTTQVNEWIVYKEGIISRGPENKTSIPVALFFTGKVKGAMTVKPPLASLADMQIELFRASSREDEVLTYAGSPMLKAKGFDKDPNNQPTVGPKTVLYAPAMGDVETDWDYLQPDAANIKECRDKVASIIEDMRRLGMQPALDKSGNPTATGQSIDAAKSHSTLKSWAVAYNDTVEQAWVFTAEYLGVEDTIETTISTDFSVIAYNPNALTALQNARNGRDISHSTFLTELQRFEVIRSDLDVNKEVEECAKELEGEAQTVPLDPTGQPLQIQRGAVLL